jgi:hypothetical protein
VCTDLLGINFEDLGSQGEQGDDGGGEGAGGGGGARTHLPRAMDPGPTFDSILYSYQIIIYLPFFYLCKYKYGTRVFFSEFKLYRRVFFLGRSLYIREKCIINYTYTILNTNQCLNQYFFCKLYILWNTKRFILKDFETTVRKRLKGAQV